MVEGGGGGGEEGGACVLLEQFGGRLKRRKLYYMCENMHIVHVHVISVIHLDCMCRHAGTLTCVW